AGTTVLASDAGPVTASLTVNVTSPLASLTIQALQHVASLGLASGRAVLTPGGNFGVKTSSLSINGATAQLDLTTNTLVVEATPATKAAVMSSLAALINSGKSNPSGGDWTGNGITSSSVANDATHNTTLALVDNADLGLASFAGVSLTAN